MATKTLAVVSVVFFLFTCWAVGGVMMKLDAARLEQALAQAEGAEVAGMFQADFAALFEGASEGRYQHFRNRNPSDYGRYRPVLDFFCWFESRYEELDAALKTEQNRVPWATLLSDDAPKSLEGIRGRLAMLDHYEKVISEHWVKVLAMASEGDRRLRELSLPRGGLDAVIAQWREGMQEASEANTAYMLHLRGFLGSVRAVFELLESKFGTYTLVGKVIVFGRDEDHPAFNRLVKDTQAKMRQLSDWQAAYANRLRKAVGSLKSPAR